MGGQPPTIFEQSPLIDQKPSFLDVNLPIELEDNEINSPVELPAHYDTQSPPIDEPHTEHHNQPWVENIVQNNGYGIATSTEQPTPPPKSSRRLSAAVGMEGGGGSRPLMVVGAEGTDRPHSEYDSYLTEGIMHMQLNDGDAHAPVYGTAR